MVRSSLSLLFYFVTSARTRATLSFLLIILTQAGGGRLVSARLVRWTQHQWVKNESKIIASSFPLSFLSHSFYCLLTFFDSRPWIVVRSSVIQSMTGPDETYLQVSFTMSARCFVSLLQPAPSLSLFLSLSLSLLPAVIHTSQSITSTRLVLISQGCILKPWFLLSSLSTSR